VTRTETYHLNLPTKITFAGNKEIAYTYDAAGTKLSKTATQNGTAISQTDYVNGHIYQDGQLEFFGMAEGRMYAQRDANGNFEALKPEYHLTDHLGNLRVAWRPEQAAQTNSFLMTAEPENKADEDTTFQNLAEAPKAKGYKGANSVSLSQYDAPISKEFIPLEKNQEVEISVLGLREIIENAEESDIPTSVEKNKEGIIPVPIIVNNAKHQGDQPASVRANFLGIIPFAKKLFSKKKENLVKAAKPLPEGELVISFYDTSKVLLEEKTLKLSEINSWETLSFSTKAEEKGFVSASIRGTSSESVKFDDFSIQLKSLYSAKLYQENHYYPFGMNMKGLESSDKQTQQNKKEHEWQYNGRTEKETSFDLYWNITNFRTYDYQLGRFHQIDPLTEYFSGINGYNYAFNNPVSFNDPLGLAPENTGPRLGVGGWIKRQWNRFKAKLKDNKEQRKSRKRSRASRKNGTRTSDHNGNLNLSKSYQARWRGSLSRLFRRKPKGERPKEVNFGSGTRRYVNTPTPTATTTTSTNQNCRCSSSWSFRYDPRAGRRRNGLGMRGYRRIVRQYLNANCTDCMVTVQIISDLFLGQEDTPSRAYTWGGFGSGTATAQQFHDRQMQLILWRLNSMAARRGGAIFYNPRLPNGLVQFNNATSAFLINMGAIRRPVSYTIRIDIN